MIYPRKWVARGRKTETPTIRWMIILGGVALSIAFGCSTSESGKAESMVVIASSERGRPQIDYAGPGVLNYTRSFEKFSFEIGPMAGTPWIKATGEMSGTNSEVIISIHSSSDRAYAIQLWGVSSKSGDENLAEEKAKERIMVPAGEENIKLRRYIVWTYDFDKN